MTWNKYLRKTKKISEKTGIKYRTIRSWIFNKSVPNEYFEQLQPVLAKLGHKLTTIEMGELNDTAKS
jgi:uncharacterized protein YjcR